MPRIGRLVDRSRAETGNLSETPRRASAASPAIIATFWTTPRSCWNAPTSAFPARRDFRSDRRVHLAGQLQSVAIRASAVFGAFDARHVATGDLETRSRLNLDVTRHTRERSLCDTPGFVKDGRAAFRRRLRIA